MPSKYLPVNVSNIIYLAIRATDDISIAEEFSLDRGPSEMSRHGKVSDGGDHGDSSGDVVEDPLFARFGHSQPSKDERCDGHDGCNSPIPIATAYGDADIRRRLECGQLVVWDWYELSAS